MAQCHVKITTIYIPSTKIPGTLPKLAVYWRSRNENHEIVHNLIIILWQPASSRPYIYKHTGLSQSWLYGPKISLQDEVPICSRKKEPARPSKPQSCSMYLPMRRHVICTKVELQRSQRETWNKCAHAIVVSVEGSVPGLLKFNVLYRRFLKTFFLYSTRLSVYDFIVSWFLGRTSDNWLTVHILCSIILIPSNKPRNIIFITL